MIIDPAESRAGRFDFIRVHPGDVIPADIDLVILPGSKDHGIAGSRRATLMTGLDNRQAAHVRGPVRTPPAAVRFGTVRRGFYQMLRPTLIAGSGAGILRAGRVKVPGWDCRRRDRVGGEKNADAWARGANKRWNFRSQGLRDALGVTQGPDLRRAGGTSLRVSVRLGNAGGRLCRRGRPRDRHYVHGQFAEDRQPRPAWVWAARPASAARIFAVALLTSGARHGLRSAFAAHLRRGG